MKTRFLNVTHEKCNGKVIPMFVGISEDFNLVIVGYCVECGTTITTKITLEKLIADCPKPDEPLGPYGRRKAKDNDFLKGLGINPDIDPTANEFLLALSN